MQQQIFERCLLNVTYLGETFREKVWSRVGRAGKSCKRGCDESRKRLVQDSRQHCTTENCQGSRRPDPRRHGFVHVGGRGGGGQA